MKSQKITFLIKCSDRKGLVAKITSFFYEEGFNILSCQQYVNAVQNTYFMRILLNADGVEISKNVLEERFLSLAEPLNFTWSVHYGEKKTNVAIMVSHTSHCLYDLLERQQEGDLDCNIKMVISNHEKLRPIAAMFGVPYFYLPVVKNEKNDQENEVMELIDKNSIDLIVMARYMQILSSEFINRYPQKIINIHHSFLPAFPGAKPYHSAFKRGVKIIGATSHYVTEELDEGPIIEQDITRVSHINSVDDFIMKGKDLERTVLARAIKLHAERKVMVYSNKTVVFS